MESDHLTYRDYEEKLLYKFHFVHGIVFPHEHIATSVETRKIAWAFVFSKKDEPDHVVFVPFANVKYVEIVEITHD